MSPRIVTSPVQRPPRASQDPGKVEPVDGDAPLPTVLYDRVIPNPRFETVAEAQRRARRRLPKAVYMSLIGGSEKGLTLEDNVRAFDELGFAPHVAELSSKRELGTTVMDQPISLPVILSPTGIQAVHPLGEVAVARAAAAMGTAIGLSSFASKPVEQVVAANSSDFLPGVLDWNACPDARAH